MMKNSQKTNKKYLIVLLIVFILALAIGYAAFSDTLTISGTANANGTFDLQFANPTVVSAIGCNKDATTAVLSEENDKLTVNVTDLAYPGAGAQFSVEIVNKGTIPAKVLNVVPTNITGSDNIKITGLDAITTSHPTLEAGDTCTLNFTVEWDKDSTKELTDEEKTGISFGLEIEYTQDTAEVFSGSASHTDA